MTRVVEVFEALMLLGLAVTLGGAAQRLREKPKGISPCMLNGSRIALVAGAALVSIKYTSDKVVPFLFDRWHLLAYGAILVVTAGLAFLYRKADKPVPFVSAVMGLAAGTGIVLHLFW
jgi:hypothetical protein